jgi:hypothetical protein
MRSAAERGVRKKADSENSPSISSHMCNRISQLEASQPNNGPSGILTGLLSA